MSLSLQRSQACYLCPIQWKLSAPKVYDLQSMYVYLTSFTQLCAVPVSEGFVSRVLPMLFDLPLFVSVCSANVLQMPFKFSIFAETRHDTVMQGQYFKFETSTASACHVQAKSDVSEHEKFRS